MLSLYIVCLIFVDSLFALIERSGEIESKVLVILGCVGIFLGLIDKNRRGDTFQAYRYV